MSLSSPMCWGEPVTREHLCATRKWFSSLSPVFLRLVSWLTCGLGIGGIIVWSCIPFFWRGEKKIDHDIVLWCSTILVIGIDIDPDIFTAILINTPIFGIQVQSIKLREHLRLLCWTVGKWICTFWSRLYLHERCCYSFVLLLLIPFSVTDHLSYEHSFVWWPWHILSVQM